MRKSVLNKLRRDNVIFVFFFCNPIEAQTCICKFRSRIYVNTRAHVLTTMHARFILNKKNILYVYTLFLTHNAYFESIYYFLPLLARNPTLIYIIVFINDYFTLVRCANEISMGKNIHKIIITEIHATFASGFKLFNKTYEAYNVLCLYL